MVAQLQLRPLKLCSKNATPRYCVVHHVLQRTAIVLRQVCQHGRLVPEDGRRQAHRYRTSLSVRQQTFPSRTRLK